MLRDVNMDHEHTGSVEDRLDAILGALKAHCGAAREGADPAEWGPEASRRGTQFLDTVGEHIDQLERVIAELRAEAAQLRLREVRLLSANRNLSERLVALRGDDKASQDEDQQTTATTIQTLKHDVSQREETATGLWRQLNRARRAREAARGAVELLSEEMTLLRDESKGLRSALESEQAGACDRSRQQRIALEMLFREQEAGNQALKLGEIMVAAGAITAEQLGDALDAQANSRGRLLGDILVERGAAKAGDITQAVSSQLHVPRVWLDRELIGEMPVASIDKNSCLKHACFPVRATDDCLFLAMADPRDRNAMATMEQMAGRRVVPMIATQANISAAIRSAFGESHDL